MISEKRLSKIETLKEHAKNFTFAYKPKTVNLAKNPEECKKLTDGTCFRPDIFLNNNRTCNLCSLVEHCACAIKHIDTRRKNRS